MTAATLGLERIAGRCEQGFDIATQHPDLCGCRDGSEWRVFVAAVLAVADENGGTVYQSDRPDGRLGVRSRVRGRIAAKSIGTLYRRAKAEGLLIDTGKREQSDDAAGRNTDKLDRIYELGAAALSEQQATEADEPVTIVHSTGPLCSCSVARAGEVVQYAQETVYHVRYPADCYTVRHMGTPLAPPCRQCGPGYRIGDEGCCHG